MPPVRPSTLLAGDGGRIDEVERTVVEKTGRTLDRLRVTDLQEHAPLQSELAGLRLNEFFDFHGAVRFRRLGLTFAAKQHLVSHDIGSSGHANFDESQVQDRGHGKSSAKAFFLSASTVERDCERCRARSQDLANSIPASQRLQVQDVLQRQLEVVFSEVPQCHKYFPAGVQENVMLPVEFNWDAQVREVRLAERAAKLFLDKSWVSGGVMGWMFSREEVLILSQITSMWGRVLRPMLPASLIDRTTFCRLILDLGLVDQAKVPFFWAVSLFDSQATQMRATHHSHASHEAASTLPIVSTISSYMLVCVLDMIIRKLFGLSGGGKGSWNNNPHVNRDVRVKFLLSLVDIALYKLPASVLQQSGFNAEQITKAINAGTEVEALPSSARTSFSSEEAASSVYEAAELSKKVALHPVNLIGQEFLQSKLVLAMLVEPEVLHVVAQHEAMFREMHASYVDDGSARANGHMSYSAFLQFCVDFNLTPSLVSSHFLVNAYKSTRCLEMCSPEDLSYRRRGAKVSPATRAAVKRGLVKALRTGFLLQLFLQFSEGMKNEDEGHAGPTKAKPTEEPGRRISAIAMKRSMSMKKQQSFHESASSPREAGAETTAADHASHKPHSPPSPLPQPMSARRTSSNHSNVQARKSVGKRASAVVTAVPTLKPAPKRSSVIIAEKHDKPKPKAPEEKVDEGPQPWAGVVATARAARTEGVPKSVSRKKQKVIPSKFGVSAFVESLCRIAFTYLATYGNDPQVSSCPYVRSVWLVVYLRCVFTNLRQSLEKRTAAQGQKMGEHPKPALSCLKNAFSQGQQAQSFSGIVHESLGKALQGTATQLWDAPQPTAELLAPTIVRPGIADSAGKDLALLLQHKLPNRPGPATLSHGQTATLALPIGGGDEPTPRASSKASSGSPGGRRNSSKRKTMPAPRADPVPVKPVTPHDVLCVVDGFCNVCKNSQAPGQWGSPQCPGCSIVDVLPFKNHLFSKLLVHEPEQKMKVLEAKPPLRTHRHSFTPPPIGTSHSLRRQQPASTNATPRTSSPHPSQSMAARRRSQSSRPNFDLS